MTAQTALPATGWTPAGDLPQPHVWDHQYEGPVLLHDGRVLAAGGGDTSGAQTYADAALHDPATGQWGPRTGLSAPRVRFGAVKLADGPILIAGGVAQLSGSSPTGNDVLVTGTDVFTP